MKKLSKMFMITRIPVALLVLALQSWASEDAIKSPSLAAALPEGTIVLAEIKPWAQWSKDFSNTALAKIFAEPEVKNFLAGPFAQISQLVKRALVSQKEPATQSPAEKSYMLAGVLEALDNFTSGPFAVAARYSSEDAAAKRSPAVVLILGVEGRNTEAMGALFLDLLRSVKLEAINVTEHRAARLLSFSVAEGVGRRNLVTLVLTRNRLLISNELLFCQQIIDGLEGAPDMKKLINSLNYKNTGLTGDEHLMAYLDVDGLRAALNVDKKPSAPNCMNGFFTLAGLTQAQAVAWSLKMNGKAFESRTAIFSKGEREGLLGALDETNLSLDALKICPKATPLAVGFKLRDAWSLPFIRNAIKTMRGQKGLDEFNALITQWNQDCKRDLEKDMQAAFGNEFILTSLAGLENVGPLDFSALAASLAVKDAKQADELLEQILKRLVMINKGIVLQDMEFEGKKIRYLTGATLAGFINLSPAFVIMENRLLLATDVLSLKRVIGVLKNGGSLADSEAFKNQVTLTAGRMGAMFSYVDWGYAYKSTFNLATRALQIVVPAEILRQIGIDLNKAPLPETILRHLFPGLMIAQASGNGVVMVNHGPLPSIEALAPPLTALTAVLTIFKK